ncbi:MAG: DNA-directed RNA polymerase subunit omega [Bacteroidia bacterium]|jgi:DNA-directed RNA polymerase subunit K/omega|nr:RNA polymerase Rpb6 [Bacteroidia bacterium]MCO5253052.1 DNA-directed RNA polymerase subunit omega [Bacteroidota bacterium]MCZ2130998.1 DNA-directed RNA polymerase subunit omega [Bacteroidia bacterium]
MSLSEIQKKSRETAEAWDIRQLDKDTKNIYKTLAIVSKRSNQLTVQIKEELTKKLESFAAEHDNLEEIFENREQIEISTYYEKLPKPTLMALEEFVEDKIYYRAPETNSDGF